jgi:hypothetical protein
MSSQRRSSGEEKVSKRSEGKIIIFKSLMIYDASKYTKLN